MQWERRLRELRGRLAGLGNAPLVCVVLLLALWYTLPTWVRIKTEWNSQATPSWVGTAPWDPDAAHHAPDIDTWFIHGGLVKAPRFRDTWQWWVGTWAGQVPFYRPLTSMVFWAEWQTFRDHEARYALLAILIHLLAAWQFLLLSFALFRHFRCPLPQWAMLIAGLIFVQGLFIFPTRILTNNYIFDPWKNQPDSLCALFFFLSLRSYLRMLERDTDRPALAPSADSPHAGGDLSGSAGFARAGTALSGSMAMVWFIAACLCKEAAIVLPLLLIVLEWPQLRARVVRRNPKPSGEPTQDTVSLPASILAWRRLGPMLAVIPVFLMVRTLCLKQAIGFRYGDNSDWPLRLRNEAFGPLLRFVQLETVPGAILCGLGMVLFAVGVVNVCRRRPQLACFGYLWALTALIFPLLTPSVPPFSLAGILFSHYTNLHRYYLVEAGFALMAGSGLLLWRKEKD
jgi:hypothetical protein